MHTGALMALRQLLGQYLVYGKPWQRTLIVVVVTGGAAALTALGIAAGHVTLAVAGGALLLLVGIICVRVAHARRISRRVRG